VTLFEASHVLKPATSTVASLDLSIRISKYPDPESLLPSESVFGVKGNLAHIGCDPYGCSPLFTKKNVIVLVKEVSIAQDSVPFRKPVFVWVGVESSVIL